MDSIIIKSRITEWIKKYKFVWIVLMAGILLMILPEGSKMEKTEQLQTQIGPQSSLSMEAKLEEVLGCLNGAGKVKVMLSIDKGEQTLYQTDSTYSKNENSTDTKTQTILTTDSERNESGLVHQINPPTYLGAVILAQGADNPTVKLSIVEAVSKATGLGADKISVLKMQ